MQSPKQALSIGIHRFVDAHSPNCSGLATSIIREIALVALLLVPAIAAAQGDKASRSLYDQHRWPELRDAAQGKNAPALYLGAVASAFNDTKSAEKYLNRAIKQAPNSDNADEAHGQLAYLYARLGRNRDVVKQFDRMLEIKPGRADIANARGLFAAFSHYPNQSIGKNRYTRVRGGSQAQVGDANGGTAPVRTTVVDRLAIGEVEVLNVPFMVLPDSQPPMNLLPPGESGFLGFPVVVALQTLGWTSDGTFEIGFPSGPRNNRDANLWFDGLSPRVRVQVQHKKLDFALDTGNGAGTQLWSRFSEDFASLLKERGKKSTNKVTQVGGSKERGVIALPELRLVVGGFETVLKPAQVFSRPLGDDSLYGLLGMDVLSQAREVRVDFKSMMIRLLP